MNAIAPLAKHEMLPQGLRLRPGLEFEEWVALGSHLSRLQNATSWALGDWFFYGEWEYGSRYEAAAAATGLAYQTLADLKYVAGRYEFSRRRESLSLSHHRELASLAIDEQERWLDLAEAGKWTREQLRLALAGRLPLDHDDEVEIISTPTAAIAASHVRGFAGLEQLVLVLEGEQRLRWQAAATAAGLELEEWVRDVGDAAAA